MNAPMWRGTAVQHPPSCEVGSSNTRGLAGDVHDSTRSEIRRRGKCAKAVLIRAMTGTIVHVDRVLGECRNASNDLRIINSYYSHRLYMLLFTVSPYIFVIDVWAKPFGHSPPWGVACAPNNMAGSGRPDPGRAVLTSESTGKHAQRSRSVR